MEETKLWQDYQTGLGYQHRMGFDRDFPAYVRFKEGDQWPRPTRRTRNLPRPVFNLVEMFIRTKRAGVLDQPVNINYSPACTQGTADPLAVRGAQDFTDYARFLWKRLRQDELNGDMVDDAATEGTGILHYYWDSTVRGGGQESFVGEVRGESIDALNIVFANPQEREVQKQPWVIISQRLPLSQVQAMARMAGLSAAAVNGLRADSGVSGEVYLSQQRDSFAENIFIGQYMALDKMTWFDGCGAKIICPKRQNS